MRLLPIVSLFSFASFILTQAQNTAAYMEMKPGYYLVVAAYAPAREDFAIRYVRQLQAEGLAADYGFNGRRNLFFVYLKYFDDLRTSLSELRKVREEGRFSDAWIRVIPGLMNRPAESSGNTPLSHSGNTEPLPVSQPTSPQLNSPEVEEPLVEEEKLIQYPVMTLGNTEVFLSLFDATNNRIVDGEVQVIDTERNRLIQTVKGNEYLMLPDPKSRSGQLTLIAEVFGYRKQQVEISYPLPLADTVKPHIDLMGTTLAVLFDMVRYRKGDITTLYQVYFYNDAAVMLPESKYQLAQLVEMMKENPRYRIRLHGHTNGNYHGRILALGPDNNFFSLEGVREYIGSAKNLSYERAETIKKYLIAQGISDDRIEIKAWGGKRPLYDKHSVNARRNVRVEVEVLED
jgi:outer membrane protein OmpA-like peptidoglycan-associated protein